MPYTQSMIDCLTNNEIKLQWFVNELSRSTENELLR